jgi:hypothetical protein
MTMDSGQILRSFQRSLIYRTQYLGISLQYKQRTSSKARTVTGPKIVKVLIPMVGVRLLRSFPKRKENPQKFGSYAEAPEEPPSKH